MGGSQGRRHHHDVVVVGAGPAGSSFVRTLRDRAPDADVLVLDKARFPRDKVCGDALTHTSCPLVLEVFPELVGRLPTRSATRRYTLRYPDGRVFSRDDQELDVIPRRELDHLLWEAARHPGVTVAEETRVVDVVMDGPRVVGVLAAGDGHRRTITADLIVAADGSNSSVGRKTRAVAGRPPVTAVRQYVRGVPPTEDGLVFIIDPEHHGYFWFFPIVGDGTWSANVGWFGFGRARVNPRERLEAFLRHDPAARAYVGDGQREGEVKGAPLRLAGTRSARLRLDRPPWGLGYLLVGDAAGLVHPFTGEGIAFALHSGRAAAELVASGLSDDELGHRYEEDALSFAGDVYNLPRTAMLFALPCHLPPAVRSVYLGSLPALDVLRKGAKQLRRRTAGAARAGGG